MSKDKANHCSNSGGFKSHTWTDKREIRRPLPPLLLLFPRPLRLGFFLWYYNDYFLKYLFFLKIYFSSPVILSSGGGIYWAGPWWGRFLCSYWFLSLYKIFSFGTP